MLNWTALAEELQIGRWVPEPYAAYRPLLLDGLMFLLERLSPRRQSDIIAGQWALPRRASPARRLVTLLRQCPTLHKLGQVMAHDPRLASELRQGLQELESLEPTTAIGEIAAIIDSEVGEVAGLELAPAAIAEASVAIILPFLWRGQQGVFKVLRPGVEERLREELELWPALGAFLEERCTLHGLPVLDYRNTLDSVGRLLAAEVRLDGEQAHLARAAAFYADSPAVLIPRLFPFCTPRITAMERVDGRKVTAPGPSSGERDRLAETLIEALIAKPFWSSGPASGEFHADPHAGNLFVTRDRRLAILDWALVTRLGKEQRAAVVQAVVGALTLDDARTGGAIAALGQVCDRDALRTLVADGLREVRQGRFPGFDWLTGLLDRLGTTAAMRFPDDLSLFRKSLLTLSGVLSSVVGQPPIDHVLSKTGLVRFLGEFPGRARAPFDSRAFGSHLSNEDLFDIWATLPATPARYWSGIWREALRAWGDSPGRGGKAG